MSMNCCAASVPHHGSHALNEQELSVVCGENQLSGIEGGVFGRDLSSERVVLGRLLVWGMGMDLGISPWRIPR